MQRDTFVKKIATLIIGILALLGCTKADPDLIVGNWKIATCFVTYANGETGYTDAYPVRTWSFKEDGTGYIDGKTIMEWSRRDFFLFITDYSIAKTLRYEIITLTDKMLKVYWYYTPEGWAYEMTFMPWETTI